MYIYSFIQNIIIKKMFKGREGVSIKNFQKLKIYKLLIEVCRSRFVLIVFMKLCIFTVITKIKLELYIWDCYRAKP